MTAGRYRYSMGVRIFTISRDRFTLCVCGGGGGGGRGGYNNIDRVGGCHKIMIEETLSGGRYSMGSLYFVTL